MRFRTGAAAMLLLLGIAAPVSAQYPDAISDGRRALSFGVLTGGGGMIGYTLMLSPRTALTLDAQVDARFAHDKAASGDVTLSEQDDFQLEVLLAPGFRRYMGGRGEVASYIAGRLLLGIDGTITEIRTPGVTTTTKNWVPMAGGAFGFGLEWFVTDAMSLRGEAFLDGVFRYNNRTNETTGIEQTSWTIDAGLGQSTLGLSIWF